MAFNSSEQTWSSFETQVRCGRTSSFRDLIDIQLLRDLIDDLHAVRTACVEIFELRGKHAWPPCVTVWQPGHRSVHH